ncbi:MAG TPA: chloride channel protein [Planctomycetota bacterium]|nr:chloride channel protein [Planctomycetota bacterium]
MLDILSAPPPIRAESGSDPRPPGDFTLTARVLPLAVLAVGIGAVATFVADALLRLIALFTNLFYFHRLSLDAVRPADAVLGWMSLGVPVAGALIIGVLARFGSERIRGHGIPEALEAILIRGSRVEPRVALLKPLSAAISIGSGGPFGSEGPIIMTGGAFGSLIAQFFRLTSAERKTLLVAGAAAGMSATFGTPMAAVLLAVELLLFEWKPRSFIPVALASATAMALRRPLLGPGPLFPVPEHAPFLSVSGLAACAGSGLLAGGLSALLTHSVYRAEDVFKKLPIHWMWWPVLGGIVIGAGGLVAPRALGVGYDVIESLLAGRMQPGEILEVAAVKWIIWAVALGSGTSGGVLAPLLILGASLGGLEQLIFPQAGPGFWSLISMGAILGGTMRSPLTGVLFTLELTHDYGALLPLLIAVTCAHAFTALWLRRSILTEKVERRGFHVTREYSIDPLEVLRVEEVLRPDIVTFPADLPLSEAMRRIETEDHVRAQRVYPVIGKEGGLAGVVTREAARRRLRECVPHEPAPPVARLMRTDPVTALPHEPLRNVVYRMARTGFTRLPVVTAGFPRRVVGMVTLNDLLKARAQHLEEEERRERVFPLPFAPADVPAAAERRFSREAGSEGPWHTGSKGREGSGCGRPE